MSGPCILKGLSRQSLVPESLAGRCTFQFERSLHWVWTHGGIGSGPMGEFEKILHHHPLVQSGWFDRPKLAAGFSSNTLHWPHWRPWAQVLDAVHRLANRLALAVPREGEWQVRAGA